MQGITGLLHQYMRAYVCRYIVQFGLMILCMSGLCFSVCVGSGTIHISLSTIHLLMRCFWSVLQYHALLWPCCVEDFLWHLNFSFFEDFLEHLNVSMQYCEHENTLYWYYSLLRLSTVLLVSSSLCGCCWSGPVLLNGGMILWSFHCLALLLLCCNAMYSCWCIFKMLIFYFLQLRKFFLCIFY